MPKDILITTSDNFPLKGLLFEPTEAIKGAILLNTGLGIPKEFYKNYAAYLAEKGYACLVYDYRGINEVKTDKITAKTINLRNWGLIDMVDTLEFLKIKYPTTKLYLVGHSIGGQLAGLMKNHHLLERIIMISTTGGYWPLFNFPLNIFSAFMWYLHIPITANLIGYMPRSLTYRGVKIAKGVALEWAAFSRKKDYIAAFFNKTIPKNYYTEITQKIDNILFKDDQIATPRAVSSMMDYYTNATVREHWIDPKKHGLARIGHSGFFSKKLGKSFWDFSLELIEEG